MKPREETGPAIPISSVERETSLSKDTLRMWERRYGFPTPVRDQFGERLYPPAQVDKLRLIRRLMDKGYRPGKIINQSPRELVLLLSSGTQAVNSKVQATDALVFDLTKLVKAHRPAELRATLQSHVQNLGLPRFIFEVSVPMSIAIGEAWFRGELEIYHEHLFTELMQNLLRKWIGDAQSAENKAPKVLLTTFPNELHSSGLLMVEALMTMEGADCVSFGIQMPIAEIIQASAAHDIDIVALSFSQAFPKTRCQEGIIELRRALPSHIEIWVGGGGVSRLKRVPDRVSLIRDLKEVQAMVANWRAQSGRLNPLS